MNDHDISQQAPGTQERHVAAVCEDNTNQERIMK
jgi:hypothetical protein